MEICTLASGSSGNSTLIRWSDGSILVDAGISCRQIVRSLTGLGLSVAELNGILITHCHSDHIKGLQTLVKQYAIPIYASAATGRQLIYRIAGIEGLLHPITDGVPFQLAGLRISPFATPHDAEGSLGFAFAADGRQAAVVTDLGQVTKQIAHAICGADFVLLEANYQPEMLMDGPYPLPLKQRIMGQFGHLSNSDSGRLACFLAQNGTRILVLGHLSDKNNTPEQALSVVGSMLRQQGFCPGENIRLDVAPRYDCGPVYRL